MEKKKIKQLIRLAKTAEKANDYIEQFTDYKTPEEKLAYIDGMFDFKIIARKDDNSSIKIETDYISVLTAIINQKWR